MGSVLRIAVACAVLAVSLATGAPAQATSSTVVFSAAFGASAATHAAARPAAACEVTVADGADGGAVLDAAVASGCISSYAVKSFDFGSLLHCIDRVCGDADPLRAACWYWSMHLNGVPTDYGIDGYRAANGDVLSFVFIPYGPALLFC